MRTKTFKGLCRLFLTIQVLSILAVLALTALWIFKEDLISTKHFVFSVVTIIVVFFILSPIKMVLKKNYEKWQQKKERLEEIRFGQLR